MFPQQVFRRQITPKETNRLHRIAVIENESDFYTFIRENKQHMIGSMEMRQIYFDTKEKQCIETSKLLRLRSTQSQYTPLQWIFRLRKRTNAPPNNKFEESSRRCAMITNDVANEIIKNPNIIVEYNVLPQGIRDELAFINSKPDIEILVDIKVIRKHFTMNDILLKLDEIFVSDGRKFFEIGIDTNITEQSEKFITDTLNEMNIPFNFSNMSKFQRITGLDQQVKPKD